MKSFRIFGRKTTPTQKRVLLALKDKSLYSMEIAKAINASFEQVQKAWEQAQKYYRQ